jgi:hypothetical protein
LSESCHATPARLRTVSSSVPGVSGLSQATWTSAFTVTAMVTTTSSPASAAPTRQLTSLDPTTAQSADGPASTEYVALVIDTWG